MENYFYKLPSGEDVFNTLNQSLIHKHSTSFLLSAIGDLSQVSFKCPLNNNAIILKKKLEIITLTGYLKSTESHIHISVSDESCNVHGGHLMPGSIVLKSLDILLGVIPNLNHEILDTSSYKSAKVDIYVLPDCPWSKRAIKLLESYQIKYNYHLITNDDEFKKIRNRTSFNTFPQIFIKSQFIGGYSELADLAENGNLRTLIL